MAETNKKRSDKNVPRGQRINMLQKEYLTQYMIEHKDFAARRLCGMNGAINYKNGWIELAKGANLLGPVKMVSQWQLAWKELKKRSRRKSMTIIKEKNKTGNFPTETKPLTDLEKKVLSTLGSAVVEGIKGVKESLPCDESSLRRLIAGDESALHEPQDTVTVFEAFDVSVSTLEQNNDISNIVLATEDPQNSEASPMKVPKMKLVSADTSQTVTSPTHTLQTMTSPVQTPSKITSPTNIPTSHTPHQNTSLTNTPEARVLLMHTSPLSVTHTPQRSPLYMPVENSYLADMPYTPSTNALHANTSTTHTESSGTSHTNNSTKCTPNTLTLPKDCMPVTCTSLIFTHALPTLTSVSTGAASTSTSHKQIPTASSVVSRRANKRRATDEKYAQFVAIQDKQNEILERMSQAMLLSAQNEAKQLEIAEITLAAKRERLQYQTKLIDSIGLIITILCENQKKT